MISYRTELFIKLIGDDTMSFLILEENDIDEILKFINNEQLIFHPEHSSEGFLDYSKTRELAKKNNCQIILDRNLFTSLLKLSTDGFLKNSHEVNLISLFMVWTHILDINLNASLAIMENAYTYSNSINAKKELNHFKEIFSLIPTQLWLDLAKGNINSLPVNIIKNNIPVKNNLNYHTGNDFFKMCYASVLHIAQLYRNNDYSPVEKIKLFWDWNFDKLLISQYIDTYVVLLFSNQENIKAPKNSNSKDFERIKKGCVNQAWDFTYLSIWNNLHEKKSSSNDIYFFATADILLKRIFINCHNSKDLDSLISQCFPKKDANNLIDYYQKKIKNRIKPNFSKPTKEIYFSHLIETEEKNLKLS